MKEEYKHEDHSYTRKAGAYVYCVKCGHVLMKNDFSKWADRMGCNNKDHPSYESKRQLTNPFK